MCQAPTTRIGISLGDIETLDHGLGEFSAQLGKRFAAAAPAWAQRYGVGFDFHLRENLVGLFGSGVGYLPVQRSHRKANPTVERYALWHSLHQLNKTLAPPGCKQRVLTVHDLNFLYGKNAFSAWRHKRHVQGLLNRADTVVTISQHTASDLHKTLVWGGPLHVILNGAQSLVGQPQRPLAGWPADAALAPTRPFLFHLSRMTVSKNPQAITQLARLWPQMHFVLCGPLGDEAKALRARTQLPNVEFHLGIDDAQKAWAYAHCAGFVFPSLAEGFGLPPIEAMHFGKPVFLARRTSLPEVGGAVAHYFDSFDPAAMQAVVQQGLLAHQAPGAAQAVQAHAAQFNWDRCADAYLALYAQLLGLSPAAALQS
jgi:glycosyltransferase involved in cell wall biosynthesis